MGWPNVYCSIGWSGRLRNRFSQHHEEKGHVRIHFPSWPFAFWVGWSADTLSMQPRAIVGDWEGLKAKATSGFNSLRGSCCLWRFYWDYCVPNLKVNVHHFREPGDSA